MAKDGPRITIVLRSTAGTGSSCATTKNPTTKNRRTTTATLEHRTYDPVIRTHVLFREHKA